jgi:hypothetical protein
MDTQCNTVSRYHPPPTVDLFILFYFIFLKIRWYESSGNYKCTDPRAALWGPMPFYDEPSTTWFLVYVAYRYFLLALLLILVIKILLLFLHRCAPNNSSGWYGNYDGTIWLAKSSLTGIGVHSFSTFLSSLSPSSLFLPFRGFNFLFFIIYFKLN